MRTVGINCPICDSRKIKTRGVKNSHGIFQCCGCEHLFAVNTAPEKTQSYNYEQYSYDKNKLENLPAFIHKRLDEIAKTFESYRKTNRLLDVGFGAGAMLQSCKKQGWDVYGIEASGLAVEQAQRHGFEKAVKGDFFTAPYKDGFFDVVCGIELVEHMPDAARFFKRAFQVLRPGGLLYVTTPNARGISGKLLGMKWSIISPPEHIQIFSKRSLFLALKKAGFSGAHVYTEGLNPAELLHEFKNPEKPIGKSGEKFDRVKSAYKINQNLSSNWAGRAVKNAANFALRQTRLGDALKVYAKK